MDIIDRVLYIRDNLQPQSENGIDYSLKPVLPFVGKDSIKLIVVGQDPTIRNRERRGKISYTLNLDKKGALYTYVDRICNGLGLTLGNVYATNLFKYFYMACPSKTPKVLQAHLAPNLELLREELSAYENCPVITLGEPVLKLLTNDSFKVRMFWNYKDCGFHYVEEPDTKLNSRIYPFPHQPSSHKELYYTNFDAYLDFMKNS